MSEKATAAPTLEELFGPVICSYTRAQAIADGVLVDISETAREAGIRFPVAISHAAWARYVEFDPGTVGQSIAGRLWDVVWMMRCGITSTRPATRESNSQIDFQFYVAIPAASEWLPNEEGPERNSGLTRATHRLVTLKSVCGPGDQGEPVITVMLPHED